MTTVEVMPKAAAQLGKPEENTQNVTQDPRFPTTTGLKIQIHLVICSTNGQFETTYAKGCVEGKTTKISASFNGL